MNPRSQWMFEGHGVRGCLWALFLVFGHVWTCAAMPIIDAFGHSVNIDRPPQRIVSLSPNLTEILFTLGVSHDRVVGVTRFCDFPPEDVAGLPRVGGIVDPSMERIIALHPDLVVATRGNPVEILDRLRDAGVTVFAFESQGGIDLVLQTMRTLAVLVRSDHPDKADVAIASFGKGLACLRTKSAAIGSEDRPKVYYYDPVSPDWTAGRGTHISEAITLAGGVNVADRSAVAWPRYSAEALLADPPDRILVAAADSDTGPTAAARILADLRRRPGWRGLEAVRNGRICLVAADRLLRPGPRLLLAIRSIGGCIHPERDWVCGK